MPQLVNLKDDTSWRKSRLAARIFLREAAGKLTKREGVIGRRLADDPEVIPRLIQQAFNVFQRRANRLGRPGRTAS